MSAGGIKIRLVDRVLNAVNSKRSVNFDVPKNALSAQGYGFYSFQDEGPTYLAPSGKMIFNSASSTTTSLIPVMNGTAKTFFPLA